jgi:hypothetical protein
LIRLRSQWAVAMSFALLLSCSSSTTGPILPINTGDVNAPALRQSLNRSDDPEKELIFQGNMSNDATTQNAFTGQLEAHMYAISLDSEALTEITLDGESNSVTMYIVEAFDRGLSFSDILTTRPLIEASPLEAYERRGRISGVLERGQYLIVLWPTASIGYQLKVEWAKS